MKTYSDLTIVILYWLIIGVVLIGSTVSIASAQSSNNTKLMGALQAANENQSFAQIGGRIIIVGACTPGTTLDPNQCTFYNTQAIPTGAAP